MVVEINLLSARGVLVQWIVACRVYVGSERRLDRPNVKTVTNSNCAEMELWFDDIAVCLPDGPDGE